ncbi:Zinc finger, B-box [Plasmopara halstedii]|uniref:Zinc finger, B-box n=1 Tax=Plasmopara halstedii TaxID=4781 RepID=A0A0P1APW2_PLAHL|nr:Zinc finger, B-box [Plasmopara halstedii]CEG43135.1 Zinc finger, B-box [Plasmopara halstedii]|eukprot:XP_024579504.1 Zinc finger, B-box [Plasmopara halstedii]
MDGLATVYVDVGASRGVRSVSPPPLNEMNPYPSSEASKFIAAPFTNSKQEAHATPFMAAGSVLFDSLTSYTTAQQNGQQVVDLSDLPTTPETERSTSEDIGTSTNSEKSTNRIQIDSNIQNGASAAVRTMQNRNDQISRQMSRPVRGKTDQNGLEKPKTWYEILPKVLRNFKTQDREHIRQLMLPRCELCKQAENFPKADFKCTNEGCKLTNQALCLACWQLTHPSNSLQTHHHFPASICRQCQLDQITYWCAECDLQFCSHCFDQIHSVLRTKRHRKLATEDAPGPCIAKSHWSANFQNVVFRVLAARKYSARVTSSKHVNNVGEKRKRNVEVIVIDDDDEDEKEMKRTSIRPNASIVIGNTLSKSDGCALTLIRPGNPSEARSGHSETRLSSCTNVVFPAVQNPQQITSSVALTNESVAQPSIVEPIVFSHEITEPRFSPMISRHAVSAGSTYRQPTSNRHNAFNINTGKRLLWNSDASKYSTASLMGNERESFHAPNLMTNEKTQAPPTSMSTTESTTHGVRPTLSARTTESASTYTTNGLFSLGGSVVVENALVDSLVDRYHELNQNVTKMELQAEQLTRQIAVATRQGPYTAAPIMVLLSKLQSVLEAARLRRDKLFIAMIIQSGDIMNSVRLLRITELDDVPQVPMISHRKCLQISDDINQQKTKLVVLDHFLTETLNQSNELGSSYENSLIRTISAEIRMHETNIKKLKKAREVEFVRIVQFSVRIREELKHAFQGTVNSQRPPQ